MPTFFVCFRRGRHRELPVLRLFLDLNRHGGYMHTLGVVIHDIPVYLSFVSRRHFLLRGTREGPRNSLLFFGRFLGRLVIVLSGFCHISCFESSCTFATAEIDPSCRGFGVRRRGGWMRAVSFTVVVFRVRVCGVVWCSVVCFSSFPAHVPVGHPRSCPSREFSLRHLRHVVSRPPRFWGGRHLSSLCCCCWAECQVLFVKTEPVSGVWDTAPCWWAAPPVARLRDQA